MLVQDLDLVPLSAAVLEAVVLGLAVEAEQAQALEHEQEEDLVRAPAPVEVRTGWVPSTAGIENVD